MIAIYPVDSVIQPLENWGQYDSDVRECAETNYDSNGVLQWISNIAALSTRLGRKMGENENSG